MTASGLAPTSRKDSANGEFQMTERDFRAVAAAIYEDAGISLTAEKQPLVYSRLAKRLRALELSSFDQYVALIESPDGAEERRNMLAALTTNVTRFFREPHHFELLRDVVLPPLLREAERGGRVRLWSAGCSNGQEPYSIALTLLEACPRAASLDVKVLASDIDPVVVAHARAGVYDDGQAESVPGALRAKYFAVSSESGVRRWTASAELKSLIAFRELNLNGVWPMKGPFDAIFCRNVVIYFDEPTQQKLWSRYEQLLSPEGWLFVGHSERVSGPALAKFTSEGVTSYRRKAR
ncbi:MAG: protein-glutamate O-methyltransferase CheR [Parvularculaceae bacterium]|nr:protein-glutamate O-methyltransferase CheR [Parvularculaceae bacterium]